MGDFPRRGTILEEASLKLGRGKAAGYAGHPAERGDWGTEVMRDKQQIPPLSCLWFLIQGAN